MGSWQGRFWSVPHLLLIAPHPSSSFGFSALVSTCTFLPPVSLYSCEPVPPLPWPSCTQGVPQHTTNSRTFCAWSPHPPAAFLCCLSGSPIISCLTIHTSWGLHGLPLLSNAVIWHCALQLHFLVTAVLLS